jgi:(2Fe-2S) ferredoxin/precorrin-6B methylase 2
MQPFRYHVFACDQRKPEGAPCCSERGSMAVIEALRREVAARGLIDIVQVTTCGSIGLCQRGPNLVVYPDGVWYSGVAPADVPEIVAEHFQNSRPVERLMNQDAAAVKREITEARAYMVAALKARESAGVVPDDLAEAIRGYQSSRVLLTGIELDVFSSIGRAPGTATSDSVAADLNTDPRATEVLLNALVALGLLTRTGLVFANTPVANRFLADGSQNDARMALRHNLSLWKTWSALTECVRTGLPATAASRAMSERGDDWTEPFIAAMHRNAALRAPVVVGAVGANHVQRLLDVGGGSGAYSIAFARANPALRADVFDLATVVPIAERHIAEAGVSDQVRTRIGDLRRDLFGSGYDLVLLSAICHMLGTHENRDLIRRAFEALAPSGRIVVQDQIMNAEKTAPRSGALFAINMLVGTANGSTYSEDEYAAWLREAGFAGVRRITLVGPNDLIVAEKPAQDSVDS